MQWHDLGLDAGVLELHEAMTAPGPALELHVERNPWGELRACWLDDRGRRLGWAAVGEA